MKTLEYNTGDPIEKGVYACRVDGKMPPFHEDKFLMWFDGDWGYLGSDQSYRGVVHGWIGPLSRTRS
jgi:hypothetical protein